MAELPRAARAWLRAAIRDPRARELVAGDLAELHAERRIELSPVGAVFRLLVDLASLAPARAAIARIAGVGGPSPDAPREGLMNWLEDLRLAARTLGRNPTYSAIVVMTLALAIGANTAIFSVVDGVLLRPLPFEDSSALYMVREQGPGAVSGDGPIASQSLFLAWREAPESLSDIGMYSNQSATLSELPEPVRLTGIATSPDLFRLLGVDAALGRTIAPDEEEPGRDGVVLLSHRAWQRYFGGDPEVVGTTVLMDETLRTIVGVMPPGFRFPGSETDYWVPLQNVPPMGADEDAAASAARQQRQVRRSVEARGPEGADGGPGPEGGAEVHSMELWGRVIVRLAPGATAAMAADEGSRLLGGLRSEELLADQGRPEVEVLSLLEQTVGAVRQPLLLLMGAVGFVLLIACANVVNLVMARSVGRHRETAVRASLGAGRWRLARFLFAEGLVLATVGAALGVSFAWAGLRALAISAPSFIPRLDTVTIDLRVLAFTAVVTALSAFLTSLVPIRHATRLDLTRALRDAAGRTGGASGGGATRRLLVAAETAAAVVLLVGAALLISSFLRLTSVDPGYRPDGLLNVRLQLPEAGYPDAAAHLAAYDDLVRRLETLPGVARATVANRMPSENANMRVAMRVRDDQGVPRAEGEPQPVGVRMVENAYFETIGARLVEGRFFEREDRPETLPVMVLSESAAEAIFGEGARVVGERLDFIGGEVEVVGIVEDVRTAGTDPTPQPDIFLPYRQGRPAMVPMLFRVANLIVDTEGDPLRAAANVRTLVGDQVPDGVVLSIVPVFDTLADSVAEPRFYAALVAAFATLSLLLAAIGIYGVLAYTVQEGSRDTAIRRALGAPVETILRRVMVRGLSLAALGLVLGIGAALGLARFLESMLYGVEPTSPATLGSAALVFIVVALAAVWIPARRAARIDPMEVLRLDT